MSIEKKFLALRLEGALQSWGYDSQYNRRNTGLMPTKSAIAGMCCAALGYPRGSDKEQTFLMDFSNLKMTAIAIPKNIFCGYGQKKKKINLSVRRLQDYHTVQNTMRASGTINKDCVLTYRQYLTDASFGVILEGNGDVLYEISEALKDPVWGIWLGRKTCIPTAPVFAGLEHNIDTVLKLFLGKRPLRDFTRQIEVDDFSKGKDSLPDVPVSFLSEKREFSVRRVKMLQAGEAG